MTIYCYDNDLKKIPEVKCLTGIHYLLCNSFSRSVCLATSSEMVAKRRGIATVSICLRKVKVESSRRAVSTWLTESCRLVAKDDALACQIEARDDVTGMTI